MTGVAAAKTAQRQAALEQRQGLNTPARVAAAAEALYQVLRGYQGKVISGYIPMRGEADPVPALSRLDASICMPVVLGKARPLGFRGWHTGAAMIAGAFGALIPAEGPDLVPEVLVVPLLAYDGRGYRLGYGGGFYDRTLQQLRAAGPVVAIGFAFQGQAVDALTVEATDQPMDMIVTEAGAIRL